MDDAQAKSMMYISEEYKNKVAVRYLSCYNLADICIQMLKAQDLSDANTILAKYLANVSFGI